MRGRLASLLAWAATAWLTFVLVLSIANYTRGLDVIAMLLGLVMQIAVLLVWIVFPRLPLWVVAGHGLIMLSLGLGLIIAGPVGPPAQTLFGLTLPWLFVGLLPAGLSMVVAAAIRWRPSSSAVH
jgi:hypothetical protein